MGSCRALAQGALAWLGLGRRVLRTHTEASWRPSADPCDATGFAQRGQLWRDKAKVLVGM
jgi:hypothetical protein